MNTTTYGLDVAKGVFQLYWVEPSGECFNRRFTRQALLNFLAKRAPGRVALEACGSAHWWARQLAALGHKPVLLHAAFVRPFVQTNKTDMADAKAIWTAVHQPGMRQVAPKTETQQAILGLHGFRALRVKMRTMLINQLRGALFEFGIHFRRGRRAGLEEIKQHMAELEQQLPRVMFDSVCEQLQGIARLDDEIGRIEIRLNTWLKEDLDCQTVAAIPGIGPLTATALVATIGDVHTFRSGRQLAAFLGLVPRQRGTGGKVNLGGISKRGDTYLRTLLIHGARVVLSHLRRKGQSHWSTTLVQRRPANVVVVAMANKMARTAWALLAQNRSYDRDYVSVRPCLTAG